MRSLHLTIMVFCHILIASAVLYLNTFTAALPIVDQIQPRASKINEPVVSHEAAIVKPVQQQPIAAEAPIQPIPQQPTVPVAPAAPEMTAKSSPVVKVESKPVEPAFLQKPSAPVKVESIMTEKKSIIEPVVAVVKQEQAVVKEPKVTVGQNAPVAPVAVAAVPVVPVDLVATGAANLASQVGSLVPQPDVAKEVKPKSVADLVVPQPAALVMEAPVSVDKVAVKGDVEARMEPVAKKEEAATVVIKEKQAAEPAAEVPVKMSRQVNEPLEMKETQKIEGKVADKVPVPVVNGDQLSAKSNNIVTPAIVKGGLGPLHLLATTLCSYQPDRPVADENLNQLYARRANLRKSLFEFMSLKFTNLEKLSSRLGYGLQVVPVKTFANSATSQSRTSGIAPSHGWPVVGKCTAHDLKLMGEAAWCDNEQQTSSNETVAPAVISIADEQPPKITSNQHVSRAQLARSIEPNSFLPSSEQSSVISKLLHVSDMKDAPVVESTIYNLNLTQQQLATLEAHATSTRECRRNALRYTKALFNHLAEDQKNASENWPKLYALISADDCARKRMIDIVTALSGFRTDTTSIRRDNLEFAFAMDDLRTKVLDNEVNIPLTFDKQFIEVEQFLQQSVRLMLSNIDPNRAKLTSMRYRSLMYGSANSDDQCIELHQRLLAQSYPTDCNPNQFGQLPDVLRMTASSLELWSIEKEISLHMATAVDYPNSNPAGQQKVKEDVNECIANLVSS